MTNLSRRGFLTLGASVAAGLLGGCASSPASQARSASRDRDSLADEVLTDPSTAGEVATAAGEPATQVSDEVTISMVGDILVHGYVWKSGVQEDGTRNYDHLFEHVKDTVESYDIAMLDQETILGGTALGEFQGFPTFNSPQEFADAEVAAGFDVFLAATNHAMDMGLAGIESELSYWRANFPDALVPGIADSEEVAAQVPMIERGGHKIAILSYTSTTNDIPLPADAPWCVKMLSDSQVEADFAAAREAGAEAIIACPHCGTEYAEGPDEVQTYWAAKFAELGAAAVFCNHPHVLQPFCWQETSDGRRVPTFWSLGNFVSTQTRMDTMVGGMAHITLSFAGGACETAAAGLTPLVTQKAYGYGITTYKLCDYTEELAAQNVIRGEEGNSSFSRQWCVDFCAGRLGEGFDAETCEFTAS